MINKVAKMSRFSNIALIICLVNFLIGLFMLGWLFKNRSYSSRTAIDAHASNKNNTWNYKFFYLNGEVYGYFFITRTNSQLIYSSQLEQGDIVFELYDSHNNLITTFRSNNSTDTIKNILIKDRKCKVKANVNHAKGHFNIEIK